MTRSIELKHQRISNYVKKYPFEGHPHYWCGNGVECDDCDLDHPMTELYSLMLQEERALLREICHQEAETD